MAFSRLLLFLAVILLPVAVNGGAPFHIHGCVYCDTCKFGFETKFTYYIPGAKVRIECKRRENLETTYTVDGETDKDGKFKMKVEDDKGDQICYTRLVSSPVPNCRIPDPGRNQSQVILTRSNGAISNDHYSNALGFMQDRPLSRCSELYHIYFPLGQDVI